MAYWTDIRIGCEGIRKREWPIMERDGDRVGEGEILGITT